MIKNLLVFLIIGAGSQYLKAQALEIIDAIGGQLLPKVVDGIKDIKNSGTDSKIKYDKSEFNLKVKDLSDYIGGITTALSNDAKSLDAIGKITASASQLYDDLGAMESFAQAILINPVINCNNEPVQRQYALAFDRDLAQLKKDIAGVKQSVLELSIDQSLKDKLSGLVDAISSDNTDLESFLAQSGIARPTAASTINQILNYLDSISSSNPNISNIKKSIQEMLSTLNARLSSHVKKTSELKPTVDAKFATITSDE